MRLLLTGGGTAGHVLPHIAVLSELAKTQSLEILYVGSKNGPERGIIESWVASGKKRRTHPVKLHFVAIPVGKWRRYFDLRNFTDPVKVVAGLLKSLWVVARFKPEVLFSKGGYVSVPVTLATWVLRVPIVIHDSDAKPSLTTRLCGRFAQKICLGYKEALDHLSPALRKKCVVTGIPLRQEIFEGRKNRGYEMTGFTAKKPVVLVMGGSLGSEIINRVVVEALPELLKRTQVVHLVGPRPIQDNGRISLPSLRTTDPRQRRAQYRLQTSYKPFSSIPNEKLPHLYAIADVVVTRAGANSLAELTALNKKMIVIPLGGAASHGDQLANARVLARETKATVLKESALTTKRLVDRLRPLLSRSSIATAE